MDATIEPPPEADDGAFLAKICELCQLAPVRKTFKKSRENGVEIHEFLCRDCYDLRDDQFDEEGRPKDKIGKDLAQWDEIPGSHACFIKINLDLTKLNKLLISSLLSEFQPKLQLKEDRGEQDIGFSIIGEFLQHYHQFLKKFQQKLIQIPRFNSPNHMKILDNLLCLRMEKSVYIKDAVDLYYHLYREYFSRWMSPDTPINLSVSFSSMKHPFFEHWRFLSISKDCPICLQYVRKCRLDINFQKYEMLGKMPPRSQTNRFLHKLAAIEEASENDLLIRCAIIENRLELGDLFYCFAHGQITAKEILNYYKIFRKKI